jgi:dipeptidyl aminopeptidase/acylaminoacyl peptidase
MNDAALAARTLSAYEPFSFAGWNDERVLGYVVKPFGFRPDGQYPVAFLVHGGPESTFLNRWDWRWNAQVFAGRGYAVIMIDYHGSTGYGQKFTDSIAGDWGGKPLVDLQNGLAAALERYPWLDPQRMCSLGPSFGGYIQNWIQSHWPGRFKCLVNHAGVFDIRSMYYTTDELWFMEWENGGPYFEAPLSLERFNPAAHVKDWNTPMLVIHGGKDYRVPYSQGLGTFTALQRRGIPSKFVYFPDENHWIRRPASALAWYEIVFQWLDRYLQ